MNIGKLDTLKNIDNNVLLLKQDMSHFVHDNILELYNTKFSDFVCKYYKQYESEYLNKWEIEYLFSNICKKYFKYSFKK